MYARCVPRPTRPGGDASRRDAVVEVNHAVAETAFVQQFERHAYVVGQGVRATSHHDRCDEQVALVDQPRFECLGGEVGAAHRDGRSRRRFHPPYRFGVEVSLDPRPDAGYRLQRP